MRPLPVLNGSPFFSSIAPTLLQLLVGGLAGFFIGTLRERRAELRRAVDGARHLLHEFEDLGCDYWQRAGNDPNIGQLEWTIQSRSKRLGLTLEDIELRRRDVNFTEPLTALRQAITRQPFGSVGRPTHPDRIALIQERANELERDLNRCSRPKWPWWP